MENVDNKEVGKRIEEIRIEKRIRSKRAFALSIGVDPSFFDKMAKGETPLTQAYANAIALKYGVNIEWLYRGAGDKYIKEEKPGSVNHQAELAETKEDLKDAMKTIRSYNEFLQGILKTSLGTLLEGQTGNSALLAEMLLRDIHREAGGSPEKEKEILDKLVQKIGPKLNSDLKADISAGDGR
jgi:hypothetical protein